MKNKFYMQLLADNRNEAFARSTVAAFCLEANPSLEQINDVKTAVSEAVTNCVVHAYGNRSDNYVNLEVTLEGDLLEVIVEDKGCGIADVEQAVAPFYTTKPEQERSGMGFTLMQTFMDDVKVVSILGKGTRVEMTKRLGGEAADAEL